MSRAKESIAYYWFGKAEGDFVIAANELTTEDQPLLDAGVFTLSKREKTETLCPICHERIEPILTMPRYKDGTIGHYVICSETGEEAELDPREYQLYAFNSDAMLRYGKPTVTSKPKTRRKRLPRETSWIMIEREAVLDYANDPKRNKEGREPHELCEHVWFLNRVDFEKAALLPKAQKGYKNAGALRAYFYYARSAYTKKKYGVENLS